MPEPDLDALHEEVGKQVGALLSDVNHLADSEEWELVQAEAERLSRLAERYHHLDPDHRDSLLKRAVALFHERYVMVWPDGAFIRSYVQRPNAVLKTKLARNHKPEIRLYDTRTKAYIVIDKEATV